MAKFDLKFIDLFRQQDWIKVVKEEASESDLIKICGYSKPFQSDPESYFEIYLDKSTAIKFAKTLRTEINKIQEGGEYGKR